MKNCTVLIILVLGFCRPGYMQTVATLETSAFLTQRESDKSEFRRDCYLRDSSEKKIIMQQINTTRPGPEIEYEGPFQFNAVMEAPFKNFCLLFQETEGDIEDDFYIAVKKDGRYTITMQIEGFLPVVRFSRDGNSMVVFNAFSDNFFVYSHHNGKIRWFDSFTEFGLPAAPLEDMLVAEDGETVAISSSGLQVVNLETRQVLYELPTLVNASLISFSSDGSHIFFWAGTRIQEQDADYMIIDIPQRKIVELLNLPYSQYVENVGYTNPLEGFATCNGWLLIHKFDKDTYTGYSLK